MLFWLHGFKSLSQIIDQISDINFQNNLINYLENIIKQGYLGLDTDIPKSVDVSTASFKTPVVLTDNDYQNALITDVNCLVKVAKMHQHSFSCYKYRKSKDCRFNFPRELVLQSMIKDDQIHLKRSHPNINNFNPIVMTSMRCNHDVKFIPSGKDSKALVFYITDYATKPQLSIHHMLLLIAASKKSVDVCHCSEDTVQRSKQFTTKCMNRITTETEISGSHVSHFLLGHLDKKASHSFVTLNLNIALTWLSEEILKYHGIFDDKEDDSQKEPDQDVGYTIDYGNSGLVLVNQVIDYMFRGTGLASLSYYEHRSIVYKTTLTPDEHRKLNIEKQNAKVRKSQPRWKFSTQYPESGTHIQVVRS